MKFSVITLFPEMFTAMNSSMIGKAIEAGTIKLEAVDIRAFSKDKHKKCDDYAFGGGAGMLMTPQPLYDAIMSVKKRGSHVVYLSPKGTLLSHKKAIELSKKKHLVLVCGHYEGIDERVIELCVNEELSIGDYVLTGGELPAMVLLDAVARFLPGVLGNESSPHSDSHSNGLLEYPQYTRPQEFNGLAVPEVLLSGNHQRIKEWRTEQSVKLTKKRRPDL
ncbi:MAG: tRNA (guanosine(37)-N1)-methyltransferase TrmD [Firmicutes bacterium]|nr:tRNA (guanosine(37)-N1)-methyltransferase TrmD [Bacillota bacterium]